MSNEIHIGARAVGPGHPVYIIAELSANHGGQFDQAAQLVRAMRDAGADAVKVQTYTADTLTIDCDAPPFRIGGGTLWDGRTLHELYREAAMPWKWQPDLQTLATELGIDFVSTPFDSSALAFLENLQVPAHKVASFELVDLPLLRRIAATGRPIIASTGMASVAEIEEAVDTIRGAGGDQLALLKCTSAYPASAHEMNLRTLVDLQERFQVPVGLSDHTLGHASAVAAVALGASIIEKHCTLQRADGGPDAAFSLEPQEFSGMVQAIRETEEALGGVRYEASPEEAKSRVFRRSLFVVQDIAKGAKLTHENVRSIRPGHGLHPRHLEDVVGRTTAATVPRGTPLSWELIAT